MAAASIIPPITGLQRPFTCEDLEYLRTVYNCLRHPEEQPEIYRRHAQGLGASCIVNKTGHGHVFRLQPNRKFIPHEFEEGDAKSKAANTRPEFFQEFASFLQDNSLANLIALQVLVGLQHTTRMELLVGPQGTLMLDEKDIIGFDALRITTGWSLQVGDDGIISCKGGNVYAGKKYTH